MPRLRQPVARAGFSTDMLHLDFETRSKVDLRKAGLHLYAADSSTEILCMAYAFDDEPVQLWKIGDESPAALWDYIRGGGPIFAHNAAFERAVWNGVMCLNQPEDPAMFSESRMRCTMAMAYAMGLPGSLDDAAAAVGLAHRKDAKGSRIMLQLSKPRSVADDGTVTWWDDPAKFEALYAYCKQDVEVERALHKRLVELSPAEQELWRIDQRINDRGVRVDVDALDKGIALVESEAKRLNAAMQVITGGAVSTCTATGQLTDWLRWSGVELGGVAKADVTELLSRDDLPALARRALELRKEAAKSSTAKLKAMRSRAGADGRMRGLFQYHGAATGRWAARGPQLQNLTRPVLLKDPAEQDDAIAQFGNRDWLDLAYGSPLQVVSDCMRGMLIPADGHEFICCDYSNIEGRVLAWLAGEEWKLQAFRDFDAGTGTDLYLISAGRVNRCTPEQARPHRQIGKVAELALGYGGGVGAFQTMAANYGVHVEDERADQIKVAWREAHPKVVQFWRDLESAAIRAVAKGGIQRAGAIAFKKSGSFLWCQLPSKRVLCYPYPEVADKEMPWSTPEKPASRPCLSYMTVNSVTRKWERCDTYGGSLAENVTQAVARDLLADAIVKLEAADWKVVLHVHDEIVVEAPCGACSLDNLASLMMAAPAWAEGLPVAVTGWVGKRYRKD